MKENSSLAVQEPKRTLPLAVVNLDNGMIPDLSNAKEVPFDLMSDYWTPETPGESKRLVFDSIRMRGVKDMNSDNTIDLECAFFFEQGEKGEVKTICNGSRRLVGVIESYNIERGTPLLVTYKGKKKNATNSFFSDIWSVKPLIINVESK